MPKTLRHKDILFISPVGEFYGGGERSGFEFCRLLQAKGYNVITVLPRTSKEYKDTLERAGMPYRLIDCGDFDNQIMNGNDNFPKTIPQIIQLIRDENINLVISNLYVQSGPVASAICEIPNISMDRGQAYYGSHLSDFMASFSDAIIVNSMELARIYRERYDIQTPVAYSYTPAPKNGLGADIDDQRIVCVSRIAPEKNILQMLKALKSLVEKELFNGKLLIIGPAAGPVEQEYKEQLKKYIRDNNLKNNVKWLGSHEDPWSLVGPRDIYINTSEKESVGRSNIEAIKLGLPAILVDIPGHKDIFEKIGAIKYRSEDTDDLVDKLRYVIENYERVKIDAERTRLKAEAVISEESCNKEAFALIREIDPQTRVKTEDIIVYLLENANEKDRILRDSTQAYDENLDNLSREIASYLTIKRSGRIFAGNIRRRILQIIKQH